MKPTKFRWIGSGSILSSGSVVTTSLITVLLAQPGHAQVPPTLYPTLKADVSALEVVFDYSVDHCPADPYNTPDSFPAVYRSLNLVSASYYDVNLMVGSGATCTPGYGGNYRMIGPDFNNLSLDCIPTVVSNKDSAYCHFDDQRYLNGVWTPDGLNIYGLFHMEYHRECHGYGTGVPTRSILHAFSQNGGATWTSPASPDHVVATDPYLYSFGGDNNIGFESVGNIVQNPADGYYYCMFRMGTRYQGEPWWGMTIMRTATPDDPASWRGWGGDPDYKPAVAPQGGSGQFDVAFVDPGAVNPCPPEFPIDLPNREQYLPWPVMLQNGSPVQTTMFRNCGITWNSYIGKFIWCGVGSPTGLPPFKVCYSFSTDLVTWSTPRVLNQALGGGTWYYNRLIDHDSPSLYFDTSDRDMYLYSTLRNSWPDYDLVRVPVRIIP